MNSRAGCRPTQASAFLVLVAAVAAVQAAELPAAPIGFALGVTLGANLLRDDLLVPFRWTGPLVGLSASGSFMTGRVRHRPEISLSVTSATNRHGNAALAVDIGGGYRLLFDRLVGLAGGAFEPGVLIFYRQHNALLWSWDDAHDYWLNGFGIGPALAWRRVLSDRTTFCVEAGGSLLAFASRPPEYRRNKQDRLETVGFYFIENFRDLEVSLPDRYQAADVRAGFETRVGRGLIAAGYRFDLLRATWPEPGVALLHGAWFRWHPGVRR
jgi:hypothetical protein